MASHHPLNVTVDSLFTGSTRALPGGEDSGIYKQPATTRLWLDADGVGDDVQADRDNHGGPERALHHYPVENHEHWAAQFDDDGFGPGMFGENISTRGVTEADVHVGDVFTLGDATIQLAQPRQPCWKPGARLGHKTLARELVGQGRAGWFYRVIEPGEIGAGDTLMRIETAEHGITLARFWALANDRAPDAEARDALRFFIDYPALAAEWRPRLARRLG